MRLFRSPIFLIARSYVSKGSKRYEFRIDPDAIKDAFKSPGLKSLIEDLPENGIEERMIFEAYSKKGKLLSFEDKLTLLKFYTSIRTTNTNLVLESINDFFDVIYGKCLDRVKNLKFLADLVKDAESINKRKRALEECSTKISVPDLKQFLYSLSELRPNSIEDDSVTVLNFTVLDIIYNSDLLQSNRNDSVDLLLLLIKCESNDFRSNKNLRYSHFKFRENRAFSFLIEEYFVLIFSALDFIKKYSILQEFENIYYFPEVLCERILYDLTFKNAITDFRLIFLLINNQSFFYSSKVNELTKLLVSSIIKSSPNSSNIFTNTLNLQILILLSLNREISDFIILEQSVKFLMNVNSSISDVSEGMNSLKGTKSVYVMIIICNYLQILMLRLNPRLDSKTENNLKALITLLSDKCKVIHYREYSNDPMTSAFQKEVESYLNEESIKFESEKTISDVSIDLYVPHIKLCLCMNGVFHYYRNKEIIRMTEKLKYKLLEEQGYTIRVINNNYYRFYLRGNQRKKYVISIIKEVENLLDPKSKASTPNKLI